jgi:hypothetical protein
VWEGNSKTADVDKNGSVDIEVGNSDVFIKTSSATDVLVEGIYDYIDTDKPDSIKNGRFNVTTDPTTNRTIVHVRGGTTFFYRIFNSGDVDINVRDQSGVIKQLKKDQSFDFGINSQAISVSAVDPFEGIYELLGVE